MGFRLVPKLVTLNDLERRNDHFCIIFTEFGNFKGVLREVVDKTITMDNLRLLCQVVNVCRETARHPRYKFLADS